MDTVRMRRGHVCEPTGKLPSESTLTTNAFWISATRANGTPIPPKRCSHSRTYRCDPIKSGLNGLNYEHEAVGLEIKSTVQTGKDSPREHL